MEKVIVDESSPEERLALAAELLNRCRGVVVLDGVVTLTPRRREIVCVVTRPAATVARCEEENKVLIENAARALQASRLAQRLPKRPLRWVIAAAHAGWG